MKKKNFLENNSGLQILTSDGFKDFKGIKRTSSSIVITLFFKSGNKITGSPNHLVKISEELFKPLSEIQIGETILPREEVISIKKSVGKNITLYDIIGTENEEYISNNIISHNCAFVPENIFESFYASVYPTISSGKDTKIILVSTPNGVNHYYQLWQDALSNQNTYAPFEVKWSDVPGRDNEWARRTIQDIGQSRFDQEFDNQFFGKSTTIIPNYLLSSLTFKTPLSSTPEIKIFEMPEKDSSYIGIVDVAEGVSGDYSVLTIIKFPKDKDSAFEIVFTFRANTIDTFKFTEIVDTFSRRYNECFLLIEINVFNIAESLYRDYEIENILKTTTTHQKLTTGFYHGPSKFGVKTTESVKKLGLENLIRLLEEKKLIINDFDIISEMSNLVKSNKTFQARSGSNDDLAMTIILFAWCSTQEGFKELYDAENFARKLNNEYLSSAYSALPGFFLEDGINQNF